jgi:threonine dehydrogenase-like Zn-dependent dehydrogenase
MKTRDVAVVTGDGQVVIETQPVPELQPGQALIRVHASLLSPGTELALICRRRESPVGESTAFGYSIAGEVVEVCGDTPHLAPGMRVAAMGAGYAPHGTWACVPVNLATPLPDSVSFADGAYTCLAATALQAVRRTVPQLGEHGAVLGLGIVGNLAAQLYQLSGARVIAWEGVAERIAVAANCGIRTAVNISQADAAAETETFAAGGLDFANLAFGGQADEAFQQVLGCMRVSADTHATGRIVLVGGCHISVGGGAWSGNVDIRASSRTGPGYKDGDYEHGQDYPAAFVPFTTRDNMRELVHLMAERRLVVEPMTSTTCALTELPAVIDSLVAAPASALGVVIAMPESDA